MVYRLLYGLREALKVPEEGAKGKSPNICKKEEKLNN